MYTFSPINKFLVKLEKKMFRHPRSIVPLTKNLINLEFKYITPDRYKDVMFHLTNMCSKPNPLNRTFCECIKKGGHEYIEYFTFKTLNDKLSLMALNNKNQVVGVVLNGIAKPQDLIDLKYSIEGIREPHLKNMLQLQLEENMVYNIFDLCNTKKAFEIRLLSVDNKNDNGRIMGKQLIRLSEALAANKNHKVMKSDATGLFTKKILSYCGFKCFQEKYYNKYINGESTTPLKIANLPQTKYQLLYKLLQ